MKLPKRITCEKCGKRRVGWCWSIGGEALVQYFTGPKVSGEYKLRLHYFICRSCAEDLSRDLLVVLFAFNTRKQE